jgi:uncharacterized protein DUF3822
MIKEINKIKNNKVDFLNLQENHLSIQLSLDGFSFSIYNKIQNEIGAFAVYEFENNSISPYKHLELIEQLYKQDVLLQAKYDSVSVTHLNNLVTQVPKPFFDKDNLANYLQNTIKVLENDFITYDEVINTEIINVYIPFVNINNFLLDKYGTFIYKHSSTILIEKLLNSYKNLEGDFYFVNISKNNFEIIVFKNKKLELFNSFNFNTKEDFIYYILFTAEQLNLNPEELKLVLLGEIEKESELFTILYQYVRNITFYEPSNFSTLLKNEISSHSHFTLLNQS